MAVFRIEKTCDYTVMSNHHLKDRTLTLKSKGLLSMMLSLPDEWNYTMEEGVVLSALQKFAIFRVAHLRAVSFRLFLDGVERYRFLHFFDGPIEIGRRVRGFFVGKRFGRMQVDEIGIIVFVFLFHFFQFFFVVCLSVEIHIVARCKCLEKARTGCVFLRAARIQRDGNRSQCHNRIFRRTTFHIIKNAKRGELLPFAAAIASDGIDYDLGDDNCCGSRYVHEIGSKQSCRGADNADCGSERHHRAQAGCE